MSSLNVLSGLHEITMFFNRTPGIVVRPLWKEGESFVADADGQILSSEFPCSR